MQALGLNRLALFRIQPFRADVCLSAIATARLNSATAAAIVQIALCVVCTVSLSADGASTEIGASWVN